YDHKYDRKVSFVPLLQSLDAYIIFWHVNWLDRNSAPLLFHLPKQPFVVLPVTTVYQFAARENLDALQYCQYTILLEKFPHQQTLYPLLVNHSEHRFLSKPDLSLVLGLLGNRIINRQLSFLLRKPVSSDSRNG